MKIYLYQDADKALLRGGQVDYTELPLVKRSGRALTKAELDAAFEELKAISIKNPPLLVSKDTKGS